MDAWRRAKPLVFVDDLDNPVLEDADFQHLRRSLRLSLGDDITISDGRGRWRPAALDSQPESLGEIVAVPDVVQPLTVAFAPVKGQKAEWLVQKLTELQIQHIVPLITERSVVRWDQDRSSRQQSRWPRVIREAAMQSRQVRLPSFAPPTSFVDFVAENPLAVAADPSGMPLSGAPAILMIGPEGGWSTKELAAVETARLPGGVLRSETAVVVGAALLVDRRDRQAGS